MSTGANPQHCSGAESSGDPRRATARAARALVNAMARPGGETLAWLKGPATEWVSELVGVRVELAEVDPLGSVAMPTEREEESRAAMVKRGVRKTPLPDGLPPFTGTTGASPSLERERRASIPGTPAVDRLARERAQGGGGSAGSRFGPSGPVRLARVSRGGDAAVPPAGLAEQDSRVVEPASSRTPADREATSDSSSSAAMIASQLAKSGGGNAGSARIATGGAMALLARLVAAAEAARGSANSAETSRATESREMTPAQVVREGTPPTDGREPSRGVIGPALSAVGRMGITLPASDQDARLGSRGMAGLSAGSAGLAGAAALPPVDASDVADLIAEALDEEARRSGIDVGVQG